MGAFNAMEHLKAQGELYPAMYRGKVIDNEDPLEAGRVKVRVLPVFWNEEDIPDEAIPWAIPGEPNYSTGTDENPDIGWRAIPDVNCYVWVFFEEGDIYQPVYFGAAPAIHEDGTPDGPKATREADDSVGEREGRLSKGVAKARLIGSFDEPDPAYAAEYPKNKVRKTDGGLLEEWDDTEGAKRMHWYHPSGTNFEIDDEGNMTLHVVGDFHQTVEGNFQQHVKGECCIHVDETMQVEVDDRFDLHSDDEIKIESDSDMLITCGGIQVVHALLWQQIESDGFQRIEAAQDQNITVEGDQTIQVEGEQSIAAGGEQFIQSETLTHLNLPQDPVPERVIHLNKIIVVLP